MILLIQKYFCTKNTLYFIYIWGSDNPNNSDIETVGNELTKTWISDGLAGAYIATCVYSQCRLPHFDHVFDSS